VLSLRHVSSLRRLGCTCGGAGRAWRRDLGVSPGGGTAALGCALPSQAATGSAQLSGKPNPVTAAGSALASGKREAHHVWVRSRRDDRPLRRRRAAAAAGAAVQQAPVSIARLWPAWMPGQRRGAVGRHGWLCGAWKPSGSLAVPPRAAHSPPSCGTSTAASAPARAGPAAWAPRTAGRAAAPPHWHPRQRRPCQRLPPVRTSRHLQGTSHLFVDTWAHAKLLWLLHPRCTDSLSTAVKAFNRLSALPPTRPVQRGALPSQPQQRLPTSLQLAGGRYRGEAAC
jgi:hypothetical protein